MSDTVDIDINAAGHFLCEYSAYLFGCGSTCIRLEKNTRRMADAWGLRIETSIMPAHIHMSVINAAGQRFTHLVAVKRVPISFDINTRLSRLSWNIADGKVSFDDAVRQYEQIIKTPPINPYLVLILTSIANGAFCRLFGGDFPAVATVALATFFGFNLKQHMLENEIDVRVANILAALLSSIIAAGATIFHWGDTPQIAMATSSLYLVPGIYFINSVSDLIDGHYFCSLGRLIYAVILTVCMSVGLCGGMLLMNFNMFTN